MLVLQNKASIDLKGKSIEEINKVLGAISRKINFFLEKEKKDK